MNDESIRSSLFLVLCAWLLCSARLVNQKRCVTAKTERSHCPHREVELVESVVDFLSRGRGIQRSDALVKEGWDDVAGFSILQALQRQVSVTQPREVENRRDFHPGVFVELYAVRKQVITAFMPMGSRTPER